MASARQGRRDRIKLLCEDHGDAMDVWCRRVSVVKPACVGDNITAVIEDNVSVILGRRFQHGEGVGTFYEVAKCQELLFGRIVQQVVIFQNLDQHEAVIVLFGHQLLLSGTASNKCAS